MNKAGRCQCEYPDYDILLLFVRSNQWGNSIKVT